MHNAVLSIGRLRAVRSLVTRTPAFRSVVARFVAGDTIDDGIHAALGLEVNGIGAALDLLGENVPDEPGARRSAEEYVSVLHAAVAAGIESPYVSVKLTALGLDISESLALENLRVVVQAAADLGATGGGDPGTTPSRSPFVRVDMESSAYTDATLRLVKKVRADGENVGVVLQSCLYRTDADIEDVISNDIPVRLVKGAYAEPSTVAYPRKRDVDAAYRRHLARLMASDTAIAVATHDPAMIRIAKRTMRERRRKNASVEFQLLYGVRSALRTDLAAEGYCVRCYVPFGSQWYPYFVRRLAERPANLWFLLRALRK
ncbi:MAG: proline dehydrogenase family protein [Capsulimonadaceae bacterium]